MSEELSDGVKELESMIGEEYKYGFTTDVEYEDFPKGISEEIVRELSRVKDEPEWMTDFRVKAYHSWKEMEEPTWFNATYKKPDFENMLYYSAPKKKPQLDSMDDVDPNIRETYEKLGIPLEEQKMLSNVAVDAVFDSVSIFTSFKEKLAEAGVIFCSMSEAVLEHPEWRGQLEEICPRNAIRDARVRASLEAAATCDADGVPVDTGNLLARVAQKGASVLMSRVRLEEKGPLDWDSARNCALGIYDDSLRRRLREVSKDIQEALKVGDHELLGQLNKEKLTLAQRIGSI